jgi:hypothetical protein
MARYWRMTTSPLENHTRVTASTRWWLPFLIFVFLVITGKQC